MTLIGDVNVVGMQLTAGPTGFCGMSLWLHGHALGDRELFGTTESLREGLARFRSRAEERVRPTFFAESSERCLDTVHDALFGPSTDLNDAVLNGQNFGAFLLSPNLCESLDQYLIVVVSDGNQQRIISRDYLDGAVVEITVPDGTIEHVLETAENTLAALPSHRLEEPRQE